MITEIRKPEEFVRSGDRTLAIAIADLNANFEGLEGYTSADPETIHLLRVSEVTWEVHHIERGLRILRFTATRDVSGILLCEMTTCQ